MRSSILTVMLALLGLGLVSACSNDNRQVEPGGESAEARQAVERRNKQAAEAAELNKTLARQVNELAKQVEALKEAEAESREKTARLLAEQEARHKSELKALSQQIEQAERKQKTAQARTSSSASSWSSTPRETPTRCIHCNGESYGPSCPFSSENSSMGATKVHKHSSGNGRCVYCRSESIGPGCPYSPSGKHVR